MPIRVVANRGGGSRSEGLEAPFVGRDEELRQLKDLLHTSGRDPRVRLVSITGPAGIGKSRLTWEFEKYVDGLVETIFWHRGRSPAYGEGVTFWALGEMVRRRAQLTETDDEATTRRQIADTVAQFVDDTDERAWINAALLALLGVDAAPAGGRDALFAAWRVFFERIAAQGTTALVFEDLQWADDGLLDFIEHVLEWSKNLPLLVVTLSRPELFDRRPSWASGQRFMTAMGLEPLSDEHMRALLAGLAPGLPDKTVDEILRRADGIPLYAVEIVRMLVAEGKLVLVDGAYRASGELGDLAVPDTLRSLIASRLDALDPADRSLLQDASVLGQRFTLLALAAVSGHEADKLEPRLRNLSRREFVDIELDPRSPERGQYGFVQSLIREVAYGTLAKRDRRARHLAAARYFEALGDEELAGALATHYLAAHEASAEGAERDAIAVQARRSLRGAAERAAALGAHEQAVSFLEQALTVTTDDTERAAMLELQANSANSLGRDDLSEAAMTEALRLRQALGDDSLAIRAAALYGRILIDQARLPDAIEMLELAINLRGGQSDDLATAAALATLSRALMRTNQSDRAIAIADRALAVAEREGDVALVAEAFVNKGSALKNNGRWREGRIVLEAGVRFADETGATELSLRGSNNLSTISVDIDVSEAVAIVGASIELARRFGQRSIMNWQVGSIAMYMFQQGEDWDPAFGHVDAALAGNLTDHDRGRLLAIRSLLEVYRGGGAAPIAAARDMTSEAPEIQTAATMAWAETALALFEGRAADAMTHALASGDAWNEFGSVVYPIAVRAAMYAGQTGERLDDVLARLDGLPGSAAFDLAVSLWTSGAHAWAASRVADAAANWRAAADGFGAMNAHFNEAEALLDLITLTPKAPDTDMLAVRASQIFERLGAQPLLAMLDSALTTRGASLPSPTKVEASVAVAAEPG